MATSDYNRGEMNIDEQTATWNGFLKASTWGGLIIILAIGYATLALAIGMNWMIALGLMIITGIAAGAIMKMGGAWYATVGALTVLAVIIQIIITLAGMAM